MKYFKTLNFSVLWIILPVLTASGQTDESVTLKKHDAPVKAVAISTDGKTIATGGEDKLVYFWNVADFQVSGTIKAPASVKSLEFLKDGNLLVACGSNVILMDRQGHQIRVFSGYTTDIWSFSYNQPTARITAGSYSKSIKVWDFNTAKQVMTLEGNEKSCLPVCFNPAGTLIASGSLDQSVRLWNAIDGKQIKKLSIHSANIFAVKFDPSGKYLLSCSGDKTIRLWNVEEGKVIRTYVGHKSAVFDAQFSPDGMHILSCDADKNIILWETATGKKLYTFTGHTGPVNAVRFNNEGTGFLSASDDHTVRYWLLDKKYYLAGSYFEKEISERVAASDLFAPKRQNESRQDYTSRQAKADQFLDSLYNEAFVKYKEMLKSGP
jgi:WD40 repeat protein